MKAIQETLFPKLCMANNLFPTEIVRGYHKWNNKQLTQKMYVQSIYMFSHQRLFHNSYEIFV